MPPDVLAGIHSRVADTDALLSRYYPGDRAGQPIHTAYVSGADAAVELPESWGAAALELAERHGELLTELAGPDAVALMLNTLRQNPIQDLRLDFEDGYGTREDAIEDADATRAGAVLAALPAAITSRGIRMKGLTTGESSRAIRTLELVLEGAGGVPAGFVFTLPKIRAVGQVDTAVLLCEAIESAHGLPAGALRFELQIESPQAVIAADGSATVAAAIHRSAGRCTGLHYGTYDYSAACGIAPQFQSLEHPVADHAKAVMQAAAAQTGVWVCDGSTQVLPLGTDDEVRAALARHYRLTTRSLERGYYQGWDMGAGHLVTRWLANFAFYRTALEVAAPRIGRYLDRRGGAVMDEPATAQALSTVVLRGVACGAFQPGEVTALVPKATIEVLEQLRERKIPAL
nr:aldolase/citrate lyase family protein [Nocardia jejuensis]